MQDSRSFAQAVKEGENSAAKRIDSKRTPPKLQPAVSLYVGDDDDNNEFYQELESGYVVPQEQQRLLDLPEKFMELNLQLVNREKDEDLSIAEYIQAVIQVFGIDLKFAEDFMLLVNRNDFCIDSDFLKSYGIIATMSSSSHTLKLLQKSNAVEERDYTTSVDYVDKVRKVKYFLTPVFFKKLLIRTPSTDRYADYYLLLEKSVYFYQIYQLERKNKVNERLISCLQLKESEEEKIAVSNVDFALGQHFCHKEDAGWVGEQSGILGFCVVDGIGGYRPKGFDSGVMARKFAESVEEGINSLALKEKEFIVGLSAERLLMDGWESIRSNRIGGGITLIVGFLDVKKSILRMCQVGDCAAVAIRQKKDEKAYEMFFKTPAHERGFNQPHMLSHDCSKLERALSHTLFLTKGDIVFVSSDGFVDNFDIGLLVRDEFAAFMAISSASEIQKKFLEISASNSLSNEETPFSKRAIQNKVSFRGGKKDDITLLVLKI
jgi:serine/threonine protein phosphatase PrpC